MEDFIDLAAEIGVDGVELTSYWFPSVEKRYLHRLKRRCLERGITVAGAAIRTRFTTPSSEDRARDVNTAKEWIGHVVELGAPELRVFAGEMPEGHTEEEAFKWTVDALAACAEVAAERGVVVALENHGGITTTADQVIRLIDTVHSDWLRLNLDTGNFRTDPYAQITRCVPYAVTAHLKASFRTPTGKTPSDIPRVVGTLQHAGYNGFLNIEYEEEDDPKIAVPGLVAQARQALQHLS